MGAPASARLRSQGLFNLRLQPGWNIHVHPDAQFVQHLHDAPDPHASLATFDVHEGDVARSHHGRQIVLPDALGAPDRSDHAAKLLGGVDGDVHEGSREKSKLGFRLPGKGGCLKRYLNCSLDYCSSISFPANI